MINPQKSDATICHLTLSGTAKPSGCIGRTCSAFRWMVVQADGSDAGFWGNETAAHAFVDLFGSDAPGDRTVTGYCGLVGR